MGVASAFCVAAPHSVSKDTVSVLSGCGSHPLLSALPPPRAQCPVFKTVQSRAVLHATDYEKYTMKGRQVLYRQQGFLPDVRAVTNSGSPPAASGSAPDALTPCTPGLVVSGWFVLLSQILCAVESPEYPPRGLQRPAVDPHRLLHSIDEGVAEVRAALCGVSCTRDKYLY